MKVTGAQALFKSLEGEGVDIMFGIPGGAILPAYDPLLDSSVRHVLCRHEQGAGPRGRGLRLGDRQGRRRDGHLRPRRVQPRHGARRREDGLGPDRRDHRPGPDAGRRQRRLPGGRHHRHHDAGHEAQLARDGPRTRSRRRSARRSTSRAPAARARSSSTCPKDVLVNETTWQWPDRVDLPGYKPTTKGNLRQVVEAAKLIMKAKRPGPVRRRRRHQGRRHEGALRARDDRAAPRRHHADGARRVPRRARALPRHAGHARRLHGRDGDAEGRPAGRARRALRRPRHRASSRRSRRTRRSCTSTSTRPRSARTASPTCRSSATART